MSEIASLPQVVVHLSRFEGLPNIRVPADTSDHLLLYLQPPHWQRKHQVCQSAPRTAVAELAHPAYLQASMRGNLLDNTVLIIPECMSFTSYIYLAILHRRCVRAYARIHKLLGSSEDYRQSTVVYAIHSMASLTRLRVCTTEVKAEISGSIFHPMLLTHLFHRRRHSACRSKRGHDLSAVFGRCKKAQVWP